MPSSENTIDQQMLPLSLQSRSHVVHLEIRLSHYPPLTCSSISAAECSEIVSETCFTLENIVLQQIIEAAKQLVHARPFVHNSYLPLTDELRALQIPLSCGPQQSQQTSVEEKNHFLHVASVSIILNEDDPSDIPHFSRLTTSVGNSPLTNNQSFSRLPFCLVKIQTHVYSLHPSLPIPWQREQYDVTDKKNDDNQVDLSSVEAIRLPSNSFRNSWQSLHYPKKFKSCLLSFARAIITVSNQACASSVRATGMLILHGPPGSGKTTLASALAHRLCIRMNKPGLLIRVSPQAVFSKWFGESATRVGALFQHIKDLVTTSRSENSNLVIVVLDEIDAIARDRNAAAAGTDPGDALRVVNALLSGIDLISGTGVLIIATTNFLEAVDDAFRDRADLCLYVGKLELQAMRKVINESIREMIRIRIVKESEENRDNAIDQICQMCDGLSGRALRRLPVLALAMIDMDEQLPVDCSRFLDCMKNAVVRLRQQCMKNTVRVKGNNEFT